MISDSPDLRNKLGQFMPGLIIQDTPSPSGQRVVYFCEFANSSTSQFRSEWGNVVLKVSSGLSSNQIAYLEKEILVLKSMESANYPNLLWNGVFIDDNESAERYFVTIEELVDARPLRECMSDFFDEARVLDLLEKLVEALTPLWNHKLKLVHRDLKPENILIDSDGNVSIIDLALIREEGVRGVTMTVSPFGPCTPHYASPEQAENDKRNISFKSDIFSLGVIVYELLSGGELPFGNKETHYQDVLQNVIDNKPKWLDELGVECSDMVSQLVSKMMEKEPYKRHRTIDDLREHIIKAKEIL